MIKFFRNIVSTFSALILGACTQASYTAINAPTYFDGIKRVSSVAYGDEKLQTLDIYLPKTASQQSPKPIVFFLHGGRWTDGNKDQYKFAGSRLAEAGFVTVIPDYSKYPNVKFPEMMKDPAAALSWVADHAGEYGGDVEKIHVMGHSSGAHMGAILAVDNRYLNAHEKSTDIITSFVGLAGPYHFEPDEPDLIDMFGPQEKFPQMQVGTFISESAPPMYLLRGGKDTTVGQINVDNIMAAAKGMDVNIQTKTYPKLDHIGIMSAFSWVYDDKGGVVSDVVAFMREQSNFH